MTEIRFCRSFDGVRLAHAHSGRGPAMVEVATWLNHLEHDWNSPVWGPRLAELTAHYTLTRYDGRGCGLSEREVKDLTFDACLGDLEAVVNTAGRNDEIAHELRAPRDSSDRPTEMPGRQMNTSPMVSRPPYVWSQEEHVITGNQAHFQID